MTTAAHALTALSPAIAAELRSGGGGGELYIADSNPGFPCRQCLRDADVGDELLLLSYDPFDDDSTSPYRSASPIFLHRYDCGSPSTESDLPSQLTIRQLSVRAFDERDMMIHAQVIDGTDLAGSIDSMFDDAFVHMLHIHNAQRGCFAVRVDRSAP